MILGLLLGCREEPPPTPVCTELEWTTWARPLLQTWCTTCHHSALVGEGRRGAPIGLDFDRYDVVAASADAIRRAAIEDRRMPPAGGPSDDELALLDEWLACGLPGGTTPAPDPCDTPRWVTGDVVCDGEGLSVDGDLVVDGDRPCLCEVVGDLTVVAPASLPALRTVGGGLRIEADASFAVLTDAGPLVIDGGDLHAAALAHVGSVEVTGVTVAGLGLSSIRTVAGDVRIVANPGLVEVDLARMTDVGGGFEVLDNPALVRLTNDDTLATIGGDLRLERNPSLATADGFRRLDSVGGHLVIADNAALSSVGGFHDLLVLPADVRITGNTALASITGFVLLEDVGGDLVIEHQPNLATIGPFSRLVRVGGEVRWVDGGVVAHDGWTALQSVGGLSVMDDPVLRRLGLPALQSAGEVEIARIPRLVQVELPVLTAADAMTFRGPLALRAVSTVGVAALPGGLSLLDTTAVETLSGPVLQTAGTVVITGNTRLTDLVLETLETVDGDVVIRGNPALPATEAELSAAIGGTVDVGDNGP